MVVGFITTYAINAHHHYRCEFKPCSWRGVLDTTLCDKSLSVTSDRSVVFFRSSGFLQQYNWPLRYNWNIVESGTKHHNSNPDPVIKTKLWITKNGEKKFKTNDQSSYNVW